jgi:type I restriction enzyme S subunit
LSFSQAILAMNSITDKVVNDYIYFYLKLVTRKIISFSQGSGQPNLSKGIIDSVNISIPPLEEQKQIAEILTTVDDKIDILEKKKSEIKDIKKGLMQQLLIGKIRVNLN